VVGWVCLRKYDLEALQSFKVFDLTSLVTRPTMSNWDTLNALEFIVDPQLSSTPELFLRKVANQVRIRFDQSGDQANNEKLAPTGPQ
jgi:hypothetical protein